MAAFPLELTLGQASGSRGWLEYESNIEYSVGQKVDDRLMAL